MSARTAAVAAAVLLGVPAAALRPAEPASPAPTSAGTRIIVEPNVLVSRDGDVPHVEPDVAADPGNARRLLSGAITFTSSGRGMETRPYSSNDGGWTWSDALFPDQREFGAFDPQVEFGASGTAYFTSIAYTGAAARERGTVLSFYRSADGGRTWSQPLHLGYGYDRIALAVDRTDSRHRGRVYVASNAGGAERLFRSTDDGRSFEGPVTLPGSGSTSLIVLSDGTLWMPFGAAQGPAGKLLASPGDPFRMVSVTSTDGGESISPPQPILEIPSKYYKRAPMEVAGLPMPAFAADPSPRFRDRVYVVWGDPSVASSQLRLKYSTDRGRTWSTPRPVAAPATPDAHQYLPVVAVNDDGVVGVMWSESPAPARTEYDVYFTASLDGGDTFLPSRRLSSATSRPDQPGNHALWPHRVAANAGRRQLLSSAFSRWPYGGDYMGLTANGRGFHAVWPDSRRGAFQLYASRVALTTDPPPRPPDGRAARSVDDRLEVVFDPAGEEIVARLRNVSDERIWAPIAVTVKLSPPLPDTSGSRGSIQDPSTGQWGSEARFDYTPALRDLSFLAPGAVTEAVVWPMRRPDRAYVSLETRIVAR